MRYKFTERDFEKVFKFGVNYYLDSSKAPSGRTSAEPRGLGAVLDAFTRGKLVEIGAQKMLEMLNSKKQYILDFSIKSIREVMDEPDIIKIKEGDAERAPNLFIEIKNTGSGDRWIGLTDEQLVTIKKGSKSKKIYIVYISLNTKPNIPSPRSTDFVGMYLKCISEHPVFNKFDPLHASARLEFIITSSDLEKYGTEFPQKSLTYDTDLFRINLSFRRADGNLREGIRKISGQPELSGKISVPRRNGTPDETYGLFQAEGGFDLFIKTNPKSQTNYIECTKDTTIENDIFGKFDLKKGSAYSFNLETLGRDPLLKRNNLFIAKRRVYQLIEQGKIADPKTLLAEISEYI
jgi:hypothetical protein